MHFNVMVFTEQWKWDSLVRTRPCFIKNRPWQIFSSHVSMYLDGWSLHNKKHPVLHGNSPAGSSIKWHIDESYVFGSYMHLFFCFLAEGQFGSGWWNSSVRARPQESACWLGNQTKTHQNTASVFPCQLLIISRVWCGLRQYILSVL